MFNEWYARDISKKRRISNKIKVNAGEPMGQLPYGYVKDPNDPKHWIVDDEAAQVVRRVYSMTLEGFGTEQIATQLENALDYQCRRFIHNPLCLFLRVFTVAERNIDGQRNAAFTLYLIDSTDLAAGVFGKKLVSQPRIKNDALCLDITDEIVVDVNVAFLVIVHGIAFADLNFLNQANQRGTV